MNNDVETELEKLFKQQMKRLRTRGCPETIHHFLRMQEEKVIRATLAGGYELCQIPFLPIIPFGFISFYSQLDMIRHKGREGFCTDNPLKITDIVESPSVPYFAFGISIDNAEDITSRNIAASTAEFLALCVHNVRFLQNSDLFLYAMGSRLLSENPYPILAWVDSGNDDINFSFSDPLMYPAYEGDNRQSKIVTIRSRKSFSSAWDWED